MNFATTTRFDRCRFAALSLLTVFALSSGCSDDGSTTGPGGTGGTGGSGGAGGSGGSSATGGAGGTAGNGGSGPMVTDSGLCAVPDGPLVATDGSGGAGGSGGTTDGGGGTVYGSFIVSLKNDKPPAFTQFIGRVFDGPQPPSLVLKVDSQEAGCQLLVPKAPFCSPACNTLNPNGGVCIDDNTCMFNPNAVSAGTAQVSGMKGGDIMITPSAPAYVYQPSMTLPPNACDEGADVKVTTDKFTAQTKCIAPLEVSCGPNEKIPVKSGQPVRLSWKKPASPTASRVEIVLDISHHGGKKGEIDCDVPDTGSFDIPATLTTKLINLGLAGFPTIVIRRVSKASPSNEPGMKLQVDADVEREVDTGVVSCTEDKDCPTGQTCRPDLTCK